MTKREAIEEITRRPIEFFRPVRIYLFGSEARGEGGPDSDLDFLVVVPDEPPMEMFRGGGVYGALAGIPMAVDVIPWQKTDFEGRAAHVVASLPATVVREGRLLTRPIGESNRVAAG